MSAVAEDLLVYLRHHYPKRVAWGHQIKCQVLVSCSSETVACGCRGIDQVLNSHQILDKGTMFSLVQLVPDSYQTVWAGRVIVIVL